MKCILHIREGEYEGNIKPFLENKSLWEKVCASAQFRQQRKEEKKGKQSTIKSLTPFQPSEFHHMVIAVHAIEA